MWHVSFLLGFYFHVIELGLPVLFSRPLESITLYLPNVTMLLLSDTMVNIVNGGEKFVGGEIL